MSDDTGAEGIRLGDPRERKGPRDEYDVLRLQLFAAARRTPADMKTLTRLMLWLQRFEAGTGRSKQLQEEEFEANRQRVLQQLGDIVGRPLEGLEAGPPSVRPE